MKNLIDNISKKDLRKWVHELERDIELLASLVDYITDIDCMSDQVRTDTLREWARINCEWDDRVWGLLHDTFGIEEERSSKRWIVMVDVTAEVAVPVEAETEAEAKRVAEERVIDGDLLKSAMIKDARTRYPLPQ